MVLMVMADILAVASIGKSKQIDIGSSIKRFARFNLRRTVNTNISRQDKNKVSIKFLSGVEQFNL